MVLSLKLYKEENGVSKNKFIKVFIKKNDMTIQSYNPTLNLLVKNIIKNILSLVSSETYFKLSDDKKMGVQLVILNVIKNSIKTVKTTSDGDIKNLILMINNKTDMDELYELSGILKDLHNNFSKLNTQPKPPSKSLKLVKKDKNV